MLIYEYKGKSGFIKLGMNIVKPLKTMFQIDKIDIKKITAIPKWDYKNKKLEILFKEKN